MRLWTRIVRTLLRPKWVVFLLSDQSKPELGLSVWGVVFSLYKGDVMTLEPTCIRQPSKREFGESLYPLLDRPPLRREDILIKKTASLSCPQCTEDMTKLPGSQPNSYRCYHCNLKFIITNPSYLNKTP